MARGLSGAARPEGRTTKAEAQCHFRSVCPLSFFHAELGLSAWEGETSDEGGEPVGTPITRPDVGLMAPHLDEATNRVSRTMDRSPGSVAAGIDPHRRVGAFTK